MTTLLIMCRFQIAMFVIWCYGCKFLILIIVIILTFAGTLSGYCADFCTIKNCTCILFYLPNFENATNINNNWTDLEHSYTLLSAQNFTVVIITSHFCKLPLNIYRTSHISPWAYYLIKILTYVLLTVCISASFVHRQNLFFNRSPHHNLMWVIIVIIMWVYLCILYMNNRHKNVNDIVDNKNFNRCLYLKLNLVFINDYLFYFVSFA